MIFETRSSPIVLILHLKIFQLLTPWHIIVDTQEATITIKKRNLYLIGVDEKVVAFKYIRSITIDQHLFGADITIKVIGGQISAFYLRKNDANKIKLMLLDYNKSKNKKGIILY